MAHRWPTARVMAFLGDGLPRKDAGSSKAQSRKLWIPGPAGRLEAALRVAVPARAGAVIAHPHPLHGGSLNHPVVFHADRALARAGCTTLRFNFRGAGSSEGVHDEGRGELEDVAAAVSWLRAITPGLPLLVVGYSFGAWCGLREAVDDPRVAALIAIGLPVRTYDLTAVGRLGRPLAVVQGGEDALGPPDEVRRLLERARPEARLYIVEGADHLFTRRAAEAAARVVEAAQAILEAPV